MPLSLQATVSTGIDDASTLLGSSAQAASKQHALLEEMAAAQREAESALRSQVLSGVEALLQTGLAQLAAGFDTRLASAQV